MQLLHAPKAQTPQAHALEFFVTVGAHKTIHVFVRVIFTSRARARRPRRGGREQLVHRDVGHVVVGQIVERAVLAEGVHTGEPGVPLGDTSE